MIYKLLNHPITKEPYGAFVALDDEKTVSFLFDENNSDYQAYLAWIAEGNKPEAAE